MSDSAAMSGGNGKVLILGSGTGAFLGAIRSLGRAGLEVHVGWESAGAPALRSRYIHSFHAIEPYDQRSHDWVTQLTTVMRRERFDLVVATDDVGLRGLHEHAAELGRWGRLSAPSSPMSHTLFDFSQVARLARSLDLRVPESRVVHELLEGSRLDSELGLPLELSQASARDAAEAMIERPPRTAVEPAAYRRLLEDMLNEGPVTVRQRIASQRFGVAMLLNEGEPVLAFQYAHVHEPLHDATGSYLTSVSLERELREVAAKLMGEVAPTGIAVVEAKRDPVTDTWVLVGVSPSLGGCLPLALAAGVDFPMGLYRLKVHGAVPPQSGYRTGVYSRQLAADVLWLLLRLRAGRLGPRLTVQLVRDVICELARNIVLRREHFDAFSLDDPAPLMVELGGTLRRAIKLLQRRARRRLLAWTPIRRRLARDTAQAIRGAEKVLFVCTGNICRSPFAEHRARALGIFREVASAGHDAFDGSRSPYQASRAAAEWDVQLEPHRARRLTEADVRAADVIFVFDEDNEQRVVDAFPLARGRVHFIGALSRTQPLFVDDPFGGDLGVFELAYAQIDADLHEMARRNPGRGARH